MRKSMQALITVTWLLGAAGCGDSSSPGAPSPVDGVLEDPLTSPADNTAPPPKRKPEPKPKPPAPVTTAVIQEPLPTYWLDATLRLNEIQMKGTHNSYHVRPEKYDSPAWEYDMPSLTNQLDKNGVRAFELDVHWSYGDFSVFHWPYDPGTKCFWLRDCVGELKAWSEVHPGHAPLIVFLDLKYDLDGDNVMNHLWDLEGFFYDAWPREKIYTPDDFTGGYSDVHAALRSKGWPTLGEVRGKVLFVLLTGDDLAKRYANDDRGLQGRRMWVSSGDTGWRHAGFMAYDDLRKSSAWVRGAVSRGFMTRTRADDFPTMDTNFPERFQLALSTGAQLIMTDYPVPYAVDGYDMTIPGGTPVRCNPLMARQECQPGLIEHPRLLEVFP